MDDLGVPHLWKPPMWVLREIRPWLTCIRLDIFLELATISSTHSWRDCPRRTKCHGVHEQAELLAFCVLEQSRPVICLVKF
jgi:hypothetical protein